MYTYLMPYFLILVVIYQVLTFFNRLGYILRREVNRFDVRKHISSFKQ